MEASFGYLYSGTSVWTYFGQPLASNESRGQPRQPRGKQELKEIGPGRRGRVLLSGEMCGKFATSVSFLLLLQLPEVLFQPSIASLQPSSIKPINGPSGADRRAKNLHDVHSHPRL